MFERYTDRARRILVLSQEQARNLEHDFIGPEHILLGLLAEGEGVAAIVLKDLGMTLEETSRRVGELCPPFRSIGAPPFTSKTKTILEYSSREGLQLGVNYIASEHILLALLREGDNLGVQVIFELTGYDASAVRAKVINKLSEYEPSSAVPPQPRRGALGAFRAQPEPKKTELSYIGSECLRCGALVGSKATHTDWHGGIDQAIGQLFVHKVLTGDGVEI